MVTTIKEIVAEKLRYMGRSFDDDTVKAKVRQLLKEICKLLPNETDEGNEFAQFMFRFQVDGNASDIKVLPCEVANTIVEQAFNALLETILNERDNMLEDDFADYKCIRQKLIEEIMKWR